MKRTVLSLFLFLIIGVSNALLIPAFVSPAYAQPVGGVQPQSEGGASTPPSISASACKSVTINRDRCEQCFDSGGAWTALGCVGEGSGGQPGGQLGDFITSFLQLGTGLGGGVAFLLMLYSGFQRITSTGNPEKLHEAKELMTAAISGLLLIIFSIFLLRLIGVDILQLPEFG